MPVEGITESNALQRTSPTGSAHPYTAPSLLAACPSKLREIPVTRCQALSAVPSSKRKQLLALCDSL